MQARRTRTLYDLSLSRARALSLSRSVSLPLFSRFPPRRAKVGILGAGELFGAVELLMSRAGELPLPPRRRRAAVHSPFALVLSCPGHIAKRLLLSDKLAYAMLQKLVRHQVAAS